MFKLVREAEIEDGYIVLKFAIDNTSPFSENFFRIINKVYKFITKIEFDKINKKYREIIEKNGFSIDYYSRFDFIYIEPNKEKIKEKTRVYINTLKEYLKELKKINKKNDLSSWLKPVMTFEL